MNKSIVVIILAVVTIAGIGIGIAVLSGRNTGTTASARKGTADTVENSTATPAVGQGMPRDEVAVQAVMQTLELTVTGPQDGSVVTSQPIIVKGVTAPKADVFVNDTETKADANGNFAAAITLDEGENPVIVVVSDENGVTQEKEMIIIYTPAGQ